MGLRTASTGNAIHVAERHANRKALVLLAGPADRESARVRSEPHGLRVRDAPTVRTARSWTAFPLPYNPRQDSVYANPMMSSRAEFLELAAQAWDERADRDPSQPASARILERSESTVRTLEVVIDDGRAKALAGFVSALMMNVEVPR